MRTPRLLRLVAISLGLAMFAALAGAPRSYAGGDKDKPPAPTGKPGDTPAAKPDEATDSLDDDVADGLSPESVEKAIQKGVAWLKAKQAPDGSWGVVDGGEKYEPKQSGGTYNWPAGPTALALYTLLKCKVEMNDATVKKGFKYLKDKYRLPGSSYETSTMLLAVTATADPFKRYKASVAAQDRVKLTGEYRQWALDLKDLLLKKRELLGWRYNTPGVANPSGPNQDLSSTMLACIALFAADRCGIKTESKVWNDLITLAMSQQEEDGPEWPRAVAQDKDKGKAPEAPKRGEGADGGGYAPPVPGKPPMDKARGFSYIKDPSLPPDESAATGGMTACGLATILFSRHILFNRTADKFWEGRDKAAVQQSIYDGLAWLDLNFNPTQNPKKSKQNVYHDYYLYCVERAMDLIGAMKLGKHFWYLEMGQGLLGNQKPQGFWHSKSTLNPEQTLDTCFALLFLKRATRGGIPFPSVTPSPDEAGVDNRGKTDDSDEDK